MTTAHLAYISPLSPGDVHVSDHLASMITPKARINLPTFMELSLSHDMQQVTHTFARETTRVKSDTLLCTVHPVVVGPPVCLRGFSRMIRSHCSRDKSLTDG
mmetsp:Transcript_8688/g.17633  ORF Transcript_8688/g.17633 Transcript_8688/m.17633 type:complete len:102 (+) Transcript_8688:2955-3260(+)